METKQDWSIEWVAFFDEYAGDLHPSFKQKLAKQLFEKGSTETGIRGFEKYYFQLLVGQEDLKLQQVQDYMFASAIFISPASSSHSVWICWKAEGVDVTALHKQDVNNINIEFHWGGHFPKDEVLPYLKPYKKEKKAKTNLNFDIEYYHTTFPDVSLEIIFATPPQKEQLENIDNLVADFVSAWNNNNKDKIINYVSSLTMKDKNVFEVVADFGLHNSIKIVSLLLKELSGKVEPHLINKVLVK
jgi:hypothetical protein